MLDELPVAVVGAVLGGAITEWNSFAERLFGWSREQTIGRPVSDLLDAPNAGPGCASLEHVAASALAREGLWRGELSLRRVDGSSFPALVTVAAAGDRSLPNPAVVATIVDLPTGRGAADRVAEAEASAQESEAGRSAMFEVALDSVIVMDADGRITDWNASAERTFGWSREEALGREMERSSSHPRCASRIGPAWHATR